METKQVHISDKQTPRTPVDSDPRVLGKTGNWLMIIRSKLSKLSLRQKFFLYSAGLIVVGLVALILVYTFILRFDLAREDLDESYILLEVQGFQEPKLDGVLPLPPDFATEENPINGELLTKEEFAAVEDRKPIAVMIDNHVDARPLSGVDQADIVYETLVESGITRLMAVYWSNEPEEVGPIRSVRTYHLDWFSEYDAILYHIGAAYYTPDEEVIVPEADALAYMDRHGILHSSSGFWRDEDRIESGISSEHTAYYSILAFRETSQVKTWDEPISVEPLVFKNDAPFDERPITSEAQIEFVRLNRESYSTRWVYDKDTNNYKREVGGEKSIDKVSGRQHSADNLVIVEAQTQETEDEFGRILFDTIGSGRVHIMRDGEVIDGIWQKDSRTERTRYFDGEGEEIALNRGTIWVIIVPQDENGKLLGNLELH